MDVKNNTVLITGGATGIGFALAQAFLEEGNEVIICGRRYQKLREAKDKLPRLHIKECDLSKTQEQKLLHGWVLSNFKNLNILVNNAGTQRSVDFKKGQDELTKGDDEIKINFAAPVNLSSYFIPYFMKQKQAAIINVSSGLGFIPIAKFPIYCATKAAMHSFCVSLRHQLKNTSVKVFELIPPMVRTELNMQSRVESGRKDMGIEPKEVADRAITAIKNDEYEIAVGESNNLRQGSKSNFEQVFENMNNF